MNQIEARTDANKILNHGSERSHGLVCHTALHCLPLYMRVYNIEMAMIPDQDEQTCIRV